MQALEASGQRLDELTAATGPNHVHQQPGFLQHAAYIRLSPVQRLRAIPVRLYSDATRYNLRNNVVTVYVENLLTKKAVVMGYFIPA